MGSRGAAACSTTIACLHGVTSCSTTIVPAQVRSAPRGAAGGVAAADRGESPLQYSDPLGAATLCTKGTNPTCPGASHLRQGSHPRPGLHASGEPTALHGVAASTT